MASLFLLLGVQNGTSLQKKRGREKVRKKKVPGNSKTPWRHDIDQGNNAAKKSSGFSAMLYDNQTMVPTVNHDG